MDALLTYLKSAEASVKAEAFSILLGLLQEDSALAEIRSNPDEYVKVILRESLISGSEISRLALSSLTNICADEELAEGISASGFIQSLYEVLEEKQKADDLEGINQVLMILSNITRTEKGAKKLLGNEPLVFRLLDHFLTQAVANRAGFDLLPKLFMNVTSFADGRAWIISLDLSVWEGLSAQTRIREWRLDILKMIKNLCCDSATLEALASTDRGRRVINLLLRSIASKGVTNDVKISKEIRDDCFGMVDDREARLVIAECLNAMAAESVLASQAYECGVCSVIEQWIPNETEEDIQALINANLVGEFKSYAPVELEEPILVRAEQY